MSERVMVIGKGAREHALAYRLARGSSDSRCREVLVCPGNAGIATELPCIALEGSDLQCYVDMANKMRPDLIVIGPEDPLAMGLSDLLRSSGFCVFGPTQKATIIESSKCFMKDLAHNAKIPTASSKSFDQESSALSYLGETKYPVVIKADGLCAGKGVVIAQDFDEAKGAIQNHIKKGPVVIEEYLRGVELSIVALCSKDDARLFAPVRDHKQLLDGNLGPNTGGMGVVGPVPKMCEPEFLSRAKERFFLPALQYMRKEGMPFEGALFAGLMADGEDLKLLEFNARFGDPETQALLYGTNVDIYPILLSISKGEKISGYSENILQDMRPTASITMAASGYPEGPRTRDAIKIGSSCASKGKIFYAGVSKSKNGQLVTDGGRVLSCTATADTLMMAIRKSYDIVSDISFNGAQYRTDIGKTLV